MKEQNLLQIDVFRSGIIRLSNLATNFLSASHLRLRRVAFRKFRIISFHSKSLQCFSFLNSFIESELQHEAFWFQLCLKICSLITCYSKIFLAATASECGSFGKCWFSLKLSAVDNKIFLSSNKLRSSPTREANLLVTFNCSCSHHKL